MGANSICDICGQDLSFVRGRGQCVNQRCIWAGVDQKVRDDGGFFSEPETEETVGG